MTTRLRFRRGFLRLPGWLKEGDGGKVLYAIGLTLDAFAERFRQALLSRFPQETLAPESLELLGRDRGIIRGRAESDDRFAKRLVEWTYPLGHRVRGNAWGMLRQIRAYFLDEVKQFAVDRRGSWYVVEANGSESYGLNTGLFAGGNDLPANPNWARFWLGINAPAGWTYPQKLLGDPTLWDGPLQATSEYVLGIDGATQSDVQALRLIAEDWKMAGSRQEYLFVVLDPAFSAVVPNYIQYPTTSWFTFGGDVVAFSNAQTVALPLT